MVVRALFAELLLLEDPHGVKHRFLVFLIVLGGLGAGDLPPAPGQPQSLQNPESSPAPPPTVAEAAKVFNRFIESWQETGNLRNVDPELLHPLFLEGPPCSLVLFVKEDICRALSLEDRHDYAVASMNVVWLIWEYQF